MTEMNTESENYANTDAFMEYAIENGLFGLYDSQHTPSSEEIREMHTRFQINSEMSPSFPPPAPPPATAPPVPTYRYSFPLPENDDFGGFMEFAVENGLFDHPNGHMIPTPEQYASMYDKYLDYLENNFDEEDI